MLVIDQAAKLRDQAKNPVGFMYAALVHDFGKAIATTTGVDGRIHSFGHEKVGIPLVKNFIFRFENEESLINYVVDLTAHHMLPNGMFSQGAGLKATRRMFRRTKYPEDLILLAKADHLGRKNAPAYNDTETFLRDRLNDYKENI